MLLRTSVITAFNKENIARISYFSYELAFEVMLVLETGANLADASRLSFFLINIRYGMNRT